MTAPAAPSAVDRCSAPRGTDPEELLLVDSWIDAPVTCEWPHAKVDFQHFSFESNAPDYRYVTVHGWTEPNGNLDYSGKHYAESRELGLPVVPHSGLRRRRQQAAVPPTARLPLRYTKGPDAVLPEPQQTISTVLWRPASGGPDEVCTSVTLSFNVV